MYQLNLYLLYVILDFLYRNLYVYIFYNSSGSLSIMGTVFGVLASLTVSLNSIYTKRVLPAVDDNVRLLVFYNNINAMILFVPLIVVFGEVPEIYSYPDLFSISFFLLMTAGGLFGLAIVYVTGLQVQVIDIHMMKYDIFDIFKGKLPIYLSLTMLHINVV